MELFIPQEIKTIGQTLNKSGYQCYLVGGAIRNQLLGKEAKDFDLTTDADPETVMSLFKRVIPTGIKHGTVTILAGDDAFEITTYRIDGKYSDGRRPDKIEFTPSINEDLIRRDFTINSLAAEVNTEDILDINGGITDLNNKLIRAIGEPKKRFDEDALRLVRACRFASQLDFTIERNTYTAMSNTLSKLGSVSKERICEELLKILTSNHPSIAFIHFYNCGMLKILFKEIFEIANNNYQEFEIAVKDMDSIKTNEPYIRITRLLSIIDKSDYFTVLKELKLPTKFINKTLNLLNFINYDLKLLKSDIECRLIISKIGKDYIQDLLTLWRGTSSIDRDLLNLVVENIQKQLNCSYPFSIKDLDITGKDLIDNLNLKPGPELGKILSNILDEVLIEPSNNNKNYLLNNIERFF